MKQKKLLKISIITVCFNSRKTIEDTLKSVLQQGYKNYEHIIVDGGSTDGTIEIVEQYAGKEGSHIRWISEPDRGLYDAMNKGVRLATGDIIGILNSDDVYADEKVLEAIANRFMATNCDATYSNLLFKDEELKQTKRVWVAGKGSLKTGWHPPHPTLYMRSNVFRRVGEFKLKYTIAADFDFMVRMMKLPDLRLSYIDKVLIYMRIGGASTGNLKSYMNSLKQSDHSLRENKVRFVIVIDACRICRVLLQFLQGKIGYKKNQYK